MTAEDTLLVDEMSPEETVTEGVSDSWRGPRTPVASPLFPTNVPQRASEATPEGVKEYPEGATSDQNPVAKRLNREEVARPSEPNSERIVRLRRRQVRDTQGVKAAPGAENADGTASTGQYSALTLRIRAAMQARAEEEARKATQSGRAPSEEVLRLKTLPTVKPALPKKRIVVHPEVSSVATPESDKEAVALRRKFKRRQLEREMQTWEMVESLEPEEQRRCEHILYMVNDMLDAAEVIFPRLRESLAEYQEREAMRVLLAEEDTAGSP